MPDGAFANSVGCGFDAHIARMANRSKWKGRLNRFGLGSFIYVFYRYWLIRKVQWFGTFLIVNLAVSTLLNIFAGSALQMLWNDVWYSIVLSVFFW